VWNGCAGVDVVFELFIALGQQALGQLGVAHICEIAAQQFCKRIAYIRLVHAPGAVLIIVGSLDAALHVVLQEMMVSVTSHRTRSRITAAGVLPGGAARREEILEELLANADPQLAVLSMRVSHKSNMNHIQQTSSCTRHVH